MQGGKYAAVQIVRRLTRRAAGATVQVLRQGSMATISRFHAVASVGTKVRMAGFFAWIMWLVVHVMYLVGFKNRFTTVIHWAVSFDLPGPVAADRRRGQQIVARTLMARLSAAEEALKDAEQQEGEAIEPSVTAAQSPSDTGRSNSHSETPGGESVDELSAAYGVNTGEARTPRQ
jgi:NADH dehydrogenase